MAAFAIPLMVASTVISAAGAINQANSQASMSRYNAQIAQQNAGVAQAQGIAASEAQQRDAQRKIGAMVASYGASGVETDTGSPMDVLADSARQATLDKLTTQYNYALRARGYQTDSTLDSSAADNYETAGMWNATSSVLSGATAIAGYKAGAKSGTPVPTGT